MQRFRDHLSNYRIILASRSPRRQSLLAEAGITFVLWLKDEITESFPPGMEPVEVALYLARLKAAQFRQELVSNDVLITADTIVVLSNRILGKPADRREAVDMLAELSGNPHEVITGVCLTTAVSQTVFSSHTTVWFDHLHPAEIEEYVDEFTPFDKAGSYGIQEWIGYIGIHKIEGSYFNVMGLPIQQLYKQLQKITGFTP